MKIVAYNFFEKGICRHDASTDEFFLEYCGKFAQPNVPESEYLRDIGNYLHSDIIVMWTGKVIISTLILLNNLNFLGPSVVSKTISKASIERISQILKDGILINIEYLNYTFNKNKIL